MIGASIEKQTDNPCSYMFSIILVDIATLREVIGASIEKQTDNPCSGCF